jgi:hypothetical protein
MFRARATSASFADDGGFYGNNGIENSRWTDAITISGGTGAVMLTLSVKVEGSLGTAGGNPSASATLYTPLRLPLFNLQMSYTGNTSDTPVVVDGTFDSTTNVLSKSLPVFFGMPIELETDAQLIAGLGGFESLAVR